MAHICVGKLTIIGSDNGLSPERRQAIIWTNAGILLIGLLGTNFSEFLIEIQTFSWKKIRLKMSSAKYCSFRLGLNVLKSFLEEERQGFVYTANSIPWLLMICLHKKPGVSRRWIDGVFQEYSGRISGFSIIGLTHCGKMDNTLQMTFLNALSSMNIVVF